MQTVQQIHCLMLGTQINVARQSEIVICNVEIVCDKSTVGEGERENYCDTVSIRPNVSSPGNARCRNLCRSGCCWRRVRELVSVGEAGLANVAFWDCRPELGRHGAGGTDEQKGLRDAVNVQQTLARATAGKQTSTSRSEGCRRGGGSGSGSDLQKNAFEHQTTVLTGTRARMRFSILIEAADKRA